MTYYSIFLRLHPRILIKALESDASGRVASVSAGSHAHGAAVSRVLSPTIVQLMVKIAGRTFELTPSGGHPPHFLW